MITTPLISVLMPVHNGARYLQPAIDSILNQTFTKFEFLVIDDCSTDGSAEIISSVNDDRIILKRSDSRLKLAGALNLGMQLARGEFIARMDADDISAPDRLRLQYDFLSRHADIGICGGWVKCFPEPHSTVHKYPADGNDVHALSLFHSPFAHPTVMMRRDLFELHDLKYDVSYYPTEDYELWERALTCFKGMNLNKILLRYRVHEDSLTGADWSNMDEQAARVTRRCLTALNLPDTLEAGRYHRRVAMAQIERTEIELHNAAQWLQKVLTANSQKSVYQQPRLCALVEKIWFRICMHCIVCGSWALRLFLHYRFDARMDLRLQHFSILLASYIKHNLKQSVS